MRGKRIEKKCLVCGERVKRNKATYCSVACKKAGPVSDVTRAKMSAAHKGVPLSTEHKKSLSEVSKGKPRPWQTGENNANFKNKASGTPEAIQRHLDAIAKRGPTGNPRIWAKISATRKTNYEKGLIHSNFSRISKAEQAICDHLRSIGFAVVQQYHLVGCRFYYDIYIPSLNLLIEYQGDFYHGNPNRYKSGDIVNLPRRKKLVDDIWAKDARKKEKAVSAGYHFASIWESDFNQRRMELLTCIIEDCWGSISMAS
jgi:hypothetical protein